MGVQDINATASNVVYVYNSDVADSVTFAGKYCNEYMIPNNANNRLALALGTAANQRAYDAEATIYGLIEDIADAAIAVDANGVIVGAGCPAALKLLTDDGTADGSNDGGAFDFVHLAGAAKYIKTLGYAPRVVADGIGGYNLRKKQAGAWTAGANLFTPMQTLDYNPTNFSAAFEAVANSDYQAAVDANGGDAVYGSYNSWTQYKAGWDGNFSQYNFLPCGWAGYWSFEEATHPVTLLADSLAIVRRARASAGRRDNLLTRKVLCGLSFYSGGVELGNAPRWATVAKRFIDLGFDVDYFYTDATDPAGEDLVPVAGSYGSPVQWNGDTLNDGTASGSVSYAIAFGPVFQNNSQAGGSGTIWHGAADHIRTTANGLWIGGKSNNARWVKANQTEGGHSGFAMQYEVGGQHAVNANCLARLTDATMALLDGYTLIEAGFVGYRGSFYPVGDPLLRPLRV
jgi:hypothetical protein